MHMELYYIDIEKYRLGSFWLLKKFQSICSQQDQSFNFVVLIELRLMVQYVAHVRLDKVGQCVCVRTCV